MDHRFRRHHRLDAGGRDLRRSRKDAAESETSDGTARQDDNHSRRQVKQEKTMHDLNLKYANDAKKLADEFRDRITAAIKASARAVTVAMAEV